MALVIGQVVLPSRSFVTGDRIRVFVDVTLDASYPTGGYPVTPAQFGLTNIDLVDPNTALNGTTFAFDYANNKLKAFAVGGAEVANATDLHLTNTRIEVVGKGFCAFGI